MSSTCCFCGKSYEDDDPCKLVRNYKGDILICEYCIKRIEDRINQAIKDEKPVIDNDYSTPVKIKQFLDKYVIGQENAKKILSVAVYNHMKMINYYDDDCKPDVELEKSNVLMVGSSGCGKTYLIKTIAKLFNVPYAICDATGLTESGLTTY